MKFLSALLLSIGLISAFAARAGAADAVSNPDIVKREDGTVVFTVRTDRPCATKEAAVEAALRDAQPLIADYLGRRENPIPYIPPVDFIRAKMMKPPSYKEIQLGKGESNSEDLGTMYVATLKLELTVPMEQQFRQAGRVTSALWGLGCSIAVLLVIGAFFRLDEWTKGFLTTWLVVGAAGAIAGLGVFWFLVQ